ncbi:pancreatic lipase-related protein 2-like [Ochlerotatus camptorhynchus]|uniref:pancreatic lipase-related protein 2-like n=1 Tax=Ochlerotatus camptorhynchus TaxID=644619 RepID=UPI0031D5743A
MSVSLLYLFVLGLTAPWVFANHDDPHQWQVTTDDRGHMHLVSLDPYADPLFDHPAPLFNPEQDTHFYLYTRSMPEYPQIIANNDYDSVMYSKFNASDPTRIVIHGWGGSLNSQINGHIRTQLFNVGEFNVIFVDWSVGNDAFYPNSRQLVYPVGIATSNLIDFLVRTKNLRREDVVVIGHSLGAHAAGNVGKGQMGRLPAIIGLDPALPFFAMNSVDRIKDTDAEYVEVIHTNGGVLGFMEPLGDADFYPNWGRIQPGCGVDVDGSCAHQRAVDYYVESISSRVGFVASQCSSFQDIRSGMCSETGFSVRMGGEPTNSGTGVKGVFFVATAGGRPFVNEC